MKPTVLLAVPFGRAFEKKLAGGYAVVTDPKKRDGVQVLITIGAVSTDGAFMDTMPELRLICCFGSGYEGIDVAAATARGIKVANTVGSNAATVADLAVALLLASIRRVVAGDKLVRAGEWRGKNPAPLLYGRGLTGRKIGILGLGAIGEKIAHRLAAFETEIGYHSRHAKKDAPWRYFNSLRELAAWADVLMLAHRADETNRHMVNAEVMEALGPEGHIVNITRGSAIDEDALIAALRSGRIAGAGLDVFEGEPDVREDIRALPNIVLTPHMGGGTAEALEAMASRVVENMDAFFAGKPLINEVRPA